VGCHGVWWFKMKCLNNIFASDRDFFDYLLVLRPAQGFIISHIWIPSWDSLKYRMKQLRLGTHLLYRLVQHCPPERCLHSVGPNSEQNSWWNLWSASLAAAANSPSNCCGV